jgi:hypothetical protein
MAAAFDARDADEYVSHLTEDAVVSPPGFLIGLRELQGREQVRAAFAEFAEMLRPGRKLEVSERRYFVDRADPTRVLIVDELTVSPDTGPTAGPDTFGTEAALLFTITGENKVSRLQSWQSEAEGLGQLKDPVEIEG